MGWGRQGQREAGSFKGEDGCDVGKKCRVLKGFREIRKEIASEMGEGEFQRRGG